MSTTADEIVARGFVRREGNAVGVFGLPEETVAMLFALYSRSQHGNLLTTMAAMVDAGDLVLPAEGPQEASERIRNFHARMTIGYGHKSVADHAIAHWALEGVSMVAERDFLSARLLGATSQSTRFVDFRKMGFVTPDEIPPEHTQYYQDHCAKLIDGYSALVDLAVDAIRRIAPYDDAVWKFQQWETSTQKRALDAVRDVLPASVKAHFGVTTSLTGLREILDKRETGAVWQSNEIRTAAGDVRRVVRSNFQTLLPAEPRIVPRETKVLPTFYTGKDRLERGHFVTSFLKVGWMQAEAVTGKRRDELLREWTENRGHRLPPDRNSESLIFNISMLLPWAIHRDLGRHRMLTILDGPLSPYLGYGSDPILRAGTKELEELRWRRVSLLAESDDRLMRMRDLKIPVVGLQYGTPMAAIVPARWVVSLRELIHIIGLRTAPQGHPAYRALVQDLARDVCAYNPELRELIDGAANYEEIVLGRPG